MRHRGYRQIVAMIAAALLGLTGTWLAPGRARAADAPNIAQHIGIPAYFPPSASYNQDEAWGPQFTGTPPLPTGSFSTFDTAGGFAIANVVNGPDYAPDVNYDYAGTLAAEHAAGTKILGYVDTGYFGTTGLTTRAGDAGIEPWRDQIEQDVNAWYKFYGDSMGGIFLDEAQNTCGPSNAYARLYSEISTYIKDAHPGAMTVINPGTTVPGCYRDSADTIVTFEGPESSYTPDNVALDWNPGDPNKIMHIVYGVAPDHLSDVIANSKSWGAGYIDITDEGAAGDPPLYKVLPSYLSNEVTEASAQDDGAAPPAPKSVDTQDVQYVTAQLNWEASTSDTGASPVVAYDVFLKKDSHDYHWVASTTLADWRTANIYLTGLVAGAGYTAYVVARDAAGQVSAPSATVRWTQETDKDAGHPSAPHTPVATATTYSTTRLSWLPVLVDNSDHPLTYYRVYEDGNRVLEVPADVLQATIAGMDPGTEHSFTVSAVDEAGKVSEPSAPISITTLSFTGSSVASTGLEAYSAQNVTLSARVYLPFSFVRAFIDVDNNPATGYSYDGIGADYVVENGRLFSLATSADYKPTLVAKAPATVASYVDTWIIPVSLLDNAGPTLKVVYQAEGFAPSVHTDPVTIPIS